MATRVSSFATAGGKRTSFVFLPILYHGKNKNANLFISGVSGLFWGDFVVPEDNLQIGCCPGSLERTRFTNTNSASRPRTRITSTKYAARTRSSNAVCRQPSSVLIITDIYTKQRAKGNPSNRPHSMEAKKKRGYRVRCQNTEINIRAPVHTSLNLGYYPCILISDTFS